MPWDKGIDFETAAELLIKRMFKSKSRLRKCYYAVLLIQLANGSRISEAVKAYIEYLKTKNSMVEVEVSKKKKPETRKMKIPRVIMRDEFHCVEFLDEDFDKLVNRIKVFSLRRLKINTHSLRYAFITYLLKQNISPSIIAKITKHSKLDFIITYTQEKAAEETLGEVVDSVTETA
ncbi:MAG: hypothetical protein N3G79_06930 [Sulfolobales archaeon]|nr:hypothetical protein [Sulfolobales archaeon]